MTRKYKRGRSLRKRASKSKRLRGGIGGLALGLGVTGASLLGLAGASYALKGSPTKTQGLDATTTASVDNSQDPTTQSNDHLQNNESFESLPPLHENKSVLSDDEKKQDAKKSKAQEVLVKLSHVSSLLAEPEKIETAEEKVKYFFPCFDHQFGETTVDANVLKTKTEVMLFFVNQTIVSACDKKFQIVFKNLPKQKPKTLIEHASDSKIEPSVSLEDKDLSLAYLKNLLNAKLNIDVDGAVNQMLCSVALFHIVLKSFLPSLYEEGYVIKLLYERLIEVDEIKTVLETEKEYLVKSLQLESTSTKPTEEGSINEKGEQPVEKPPLSSVLDNKLFQFLNSNNLSTGYYLTGEQVKTNIYTTSSIVIIDLESLKRMEEYIYVVPHSVSAKVTFVRRIDKT